MEYVELNQPINIEFVAKPEELQEIVDKLKNLKCGDPTRVRQYDVGEIEGRRVNLVFRLRQ